MILFAYIGMVAAMMAALTGLFLTLRSFSGEARVLDRRLAPPKSAAFAVAAPVRKSRKADEGPLLQDGQAVETGALGQLIDRWIPALRRRLAAARAPLTPTQVVLGSLILFLGLTITLLVVGLPLLAAAGIAVWSGVAGPVLLISFLAARRRRLFVEQMPQAVDLIARSLQAGHPVATAMAVAAQQMPDPIGPEFATVIAEMNYGLDRDQALRNLLKRFPIAELRMFTASLEVTRETGGNVAEVLLNLGEAMRAKAQLRKKVAAISAEGKMSFWVVSGLPIAVAGILMFLKPGYYGEVAGDPLFWPLMAGPPVLWVIGAAIIWRMINFKI